MPTNNVKKHNKKYTIDTSFIFPCSLCSKNDGIVPDNSLVTTFNICQQCANSNNNRTILEYIIYDLYQIIIPDIIGGTIKQYIKKHDHYDQANFKSIHVWEVASLFASNVRKFFCPYSCVQLWSISGPTNVVRIRRVIEDTYKGKVGGMGGILNRDLHDENERLQKIFQLFFKYRKKTKIPMTDEVKENNDWYQYNTKCCKALEDDDYKKELLKEHHLGVTLKRKRTTEISKERKRKKIKLFKIVLEDGNLGSKEKKLLQEDVTFLEKTRKLTISNYYFKSEFGRGRNKTYKAGYSGVDWKKTLQKISKKKTKKNNNKNLIDKVKVFLNEEMGTVKLDKLEDIM